MKYKLKMSKKSTLPKSSSESKNSKLKLKLSEKKSRSVSQTLSQSPTQSTTLTSNPFEVASTNEPKTVRIDDLLRPRVEEVKRKRGRPSLSSKTSTQSHMGATGTTQQATQGNQTPHGGINLNQPIIAPSALKPLLKMPFTTVAQWTDVEAINLTEKEADDLVPSLEIVMKQYSSQMNSPHAALIAFSVSLSIISIQKMFIYKNEMARRKKIADDIAKQNHPNVAQ